MSLYTGKRAYMQLRHIVDGKFEKRTQDHDKEKIYFLG